MKTEVRVYPVDVQEDGETVPTFCWDCPQCGNRNETDGNHFRMINGRWESPYLDYCDFCDEDEVLLYKK